MVEEGADAGDVIGLATRLAAGLRSSVAGAASVASIEPRAWRMLPSRTDAARQNDLLGTNDGMTGPVFHVSHCMNDHRSGHEIDCALCTPARGLPIVFGDPIN